jgi:cell division protein FtsW
MKHLRIDIFLLLGVLALVGLGIVIIYSSSAAFAQGRGLPDSFYLVNHIKKVIIGFVAFLIGLSVPYKTWERLARPVMILALALLAVVITMGMSAHGARRWIQFASFGLQPSELAKVALVFFMARLLTDKAEVMGTFRKGFVASFLVSMVTFLLILKQPNYSTAATVLAISVAMVFAAAAVFRTSRAWAWWPYPPWPRSWSAAHIV